MIKRYAAKLDLIDAWRVLNQDARTYTLRRRNPLKFIADLIFS